MQNVADLFALLLHEFSIIYIILSERSTLLVKFLSTIRA